MLGAKVLRLEKPMFLKEGTRMITPYEKRLRVISCIIIAGSFAVTSPSVKIYFMGAVSQQVLAFSNLISIGLVALTSGLLDNKKTVQALRRKWFAVFTVTDAIMYGVLSLAGFFIDPAIRFVGLSIAESLFTMTGSMLINDAVNVVLSGSDLTSFQSKMTKVSNLAGFVALAIFMLIDINIDVEIAIVGQFIALVIVSILEILFVRSINQREDTVEEEG